MFYSKVIFLLFSSLLLSAHLNSNKQNFTIVNNEATNSKLLFTLNDSEIIQNENQYEFKNNNQLGLTMDEGSPQLPVYSTLFKINPDKNYDISYDIISSRTIENIDFKMRKIGLPYKRISGVDGKKIYKYYEKKTNLNYGKLGCLLSHINILKDAVNNNYENILVLEDDIIFHKNFLNEFYNRYKYLINNEKKFDLIYLGCSQKHNWNNIIIKKNYLIGNKMDGTFAMIINKNIYKKILYYAKSLKYPIDRVLYYYIQNNTYLFELLLL